MEKIFKAIVMLVIILSIVCVAMTGVQMFQGALPKPSNTLWLWFMGMVAVAAFVNYLYNFRASENLKSNEFSYGFFQMISLIANAGLMIALAYFLLHPEATS